MTDISFKSYCWSIGTTSYRTKQMNLSIELQIKLMSEFRNMAQNKHKSWRSLQADYYNYLHENKFLTGQAPRPEKDAREKTSGLVDIGLLTADRKLSAVGQVLLEMSAASKFESDNMLELASDSYLYMKQLLKTSITVDNKVVRPFIVLTYLLSVFGKLSKDEFTYFVPMCIDPESVKRVINTIQAFRKGSLDITTALYDVIIGMDNYKNALNLFLKTETVTEELIRIIGFNRKSSSGKKAYDSIFFSIYDCLIDIYINKKDKSLELFDLVNAIRGNTRSMWKKYLFGKSQRLHIAKRGQKALTINVFSSSSSISELKKSFFMVMHSFKVQATLKDYADLNKRYLKLSDCFLFRDSQVEFDIVPKAFFNLAATELYKQAFEHSDSLTENIKLGEISPVFEIAKKDLYKELSKELGVTVESATEAHKIVYDERYARFNALIDAKFNANKLIELLEQFEKREDSKISNYITDNADIPTLFEYVLGVTWYKISERRGDVLSYMKLSLDADLLPKTHAGGGTADIVYKYNTTSVYPEHSVLIEATLSEKSGQRIMEIEPVTRHLGEYIANEKTEAYSVFIPTYLNPNIVTDFRMRKDYPYLANNDEYVNGMKIIPLQTSEIKTILDKDITYDKLYSLFENAYKSKLGVKEWYEKAIVSMLQ